MMKTRAFIIGVIFIALFVFVPSVPHTDAAVPRILGFQGRLTDASGDLLGGNSGTDYFFTFAIYDSLAGGTKLWPSGTPASITAKVTQGVFNVPLGDTALGFEALDIDFDSTPLYLEVAVSATGVGGWETFTPRQRLESVPTALNADTVHGGRFINATGVAQFGGLATLSYSRFGIGTTSHGLATASQVFFANDVEFDDQVFFDASVSVAADFEVTGTASVSALLVGGTAVVSHDVVTLAGTLDYLTLSGQEITLNTLDISDDTNLTVSAAGLTFSGDDVALTAGYAIPLTASASNWDTAYSWGDHAIAGYLTSIASESFWDTAYGWGDHSTAGYLTVIASEAFWDTAYAERGSQIAGTGLTWDGTELDVTGTFVISDSIDFDELVDSMTLDAATSVALSGNTLALGGLSLEGTNASVSGNFETSGTITGGTWNGATIGDAYIANSLTLSAITGPTSVSGNFEISGSASVSALFGLGLTDCDSTLSKIVWDETTGRFACSIDAMDGLNIVEVKETGGFDAIVSSITFQGEHFGVVASGGEAIISLDWGAGGPASLSQDETVTGDWTFTAVFGAGLTDCDNAAASKLLWNATTGTFLCGSDQSGGGGGGAASNLQVREFGAGYLDFPATISFDNTHFALTASGTDDVTVGLDWGAGGPASLSEDEAVTGNWTFSGLTNFTGGASFSGTVEIFNAASISSLVLSTALDISDDTNLTVSAAGLTLSGDSVSLAAGYAIPLTASASNWDTAYSWGDHAIAGYLTSIASESFWDTAYGWGDHSTAGYLTVIASEAFWDTAYAERGSQIAGTGLTWDGSELDVTGTVTSDSIDWDELVNAMTLDANTTTALSGNTLTFGGLSLKDSNASVSADLEVSGTASVSALTVANSFSGAGLTDCDSSTSKLLWDATTGTFSCGTDQTGGGGGGEAMDVYDNTGSVSLSVTETVLNLDTIRASDSAYTLNLASDSITFNEAGTYLAIGRFSFVSDGISGSDQRSSAELRAELDVGSGFVDIDGTKCLAYLRELDNSGGNRAGGGCTTSWVLTYAAGDEVRLTHQRIGTTTSETLRGASGLTITKLADAGGADLAENYYTYDDSIEPGDVVAIDSRITTSVRKSQYAYDPHVVGVVSTNPGIVLDDHNALFNDARAVPVALAGRIPVKVSTENGRVKAGDYLTPSSVPGVAMKATKAGPIIGQALHDYQYEDEEGLVTVFVKNGYWNGESSVASDNIESDHDILAALVENRLGIASSSTDLSSLVSTDRVIAGLDVIAPAVTAETIGVSSIISDGDLTMTLGEEGTFLIEGDVQIAGTLQVDDIAGLDDLLLGVDELASRSALLESFELDTRQLLTDVELDLAARIASVSDDVTELAELIQDIDVRLASVSDEAFVGVNGLSLDGTVIISGGLQVNEIGTADGEINFLSDAIFFGRPYFTHDTGGFAVIPADQTEVQISFEREYLYQPVVNATITLSAASASDDIEEALLDTDLSYIVTQVDEHSFTIRLNRPMDEDVPFSWTALAIKEPKVFMPVNEAPAPTPEATPEPTPVDASEPTPELTPEATPEPTPVDASEPTPELTPEATPEPTPEATGEPTPEPTPEA